MYDIDLDDEWFTGFKMDPKVREYLTEEDMEKQDRERAAKEKEDAAEAEKRFKDSLLTEADE